MSMEPGWYPDPFSSGGYVRWWDGQRWGASTTAGDAVPTSDEPGAPVLLPPPPTGPVPPAQRQGPWSSSDPGQAAPGRVAPGEGAPTQGQALAPTGWSRGPVRLASWWARAAARILDSIIESLIAAPFVLAMIWPAFVRLRDSAPASGLPSQAAIDSFTTEVVAYAGWITAVSLTVSFLYQVPQNVRWGRTVGKRALGIRIRPLVAEGPLSWLQATVRWGTYAVFSVVLGGILLFLDVLWPLWDVPWRQALHDKTARTIVVPMPSPQAPVHHQPPPPPL